MSIFEHFLMNTYFALSANCLSFGHTHASLDVRCLGLPVLSAFPPAAPTAAAPALVVTLTTGADPMMGLVVALRVPPPTNSNPAAPLLLVAAALFAAPDADVELASLLPPSPPGAELRLICN